MTESELLAELGVPADAKQVLLFSQSSHLDWDWKVNFATLCDNASSTYFTETLGGSLPRMPAFTIFDNAMALVLANMPSSAPPSAAYYYSVAEIAFLQAYAESSPARLQNLQKAGKYLHLCGGGMTSPDNLLPHGETFIRNSLVAQRWYAAALGLPVMNLWIPDDFGHDSQLPVAVSAMGLLGAGFARVPGAPNQTPPGYPSAGGPSIADQLLGAGVDFIWQANDHSEILGHWLQEFYYCQGDTIDQQGTDAAHTNAKILVYYQTNSPNAPTKKYIFVPIGCDFAPPKELLLTYMANWNKGSGPASYQQTGAWAVAATFDHYVQLISFHLDELTKRTFDATPYWLGFYASRPANKTLHYNATRTLLGAEVLGIIADVAGGDRGGNAARLEAEQNAWGVLVPSTHHDYITGTSGANIMDVNADEQVPRLLLAQSLASDLRGGALRELAMGIAADPPPFDGVYSVPVVVCNPLGFARMGLVALPGGAGLGVQSVLPWNAPVQQSYDGSLLFMADAPSLGYSTILLGTNSNPSQSSSLSLTSDSGSITLTNEFVTAVVDANGDVSSLVDLIAGPSNILNGSGNTLAFYNDEGNIYRYGNEVGAPFTVSPPPSVAAPLETLENGPLRVTVRSTTTVTFDGQPSTIVRTYSLVAGEPFLRMSITGSVPQNTSLFVQFGFAAGAVDSLTRGTTYHWDDHQAVLYWPAPVFYATHDFAIPTAANTAPLCAIYHDAVPSWGYDGSGNLLGNVLRNTPAGRDSQSWLGASAADPGTHTQHYAIRVPTGLDSPATGRPLQEAMQFHTPMLAATITPPPLSSGKYPQTFSLASITSPSSAILTAAKAADDTPADLILRVYQPTNAPPPDGTSVTILTAVDASRSTIQTALEGEFEHRPANAAITSATPDNVVVQMQNALATVRLIGSL